MEFAYFTVAGIAFYLFSDWVLVQIEQWRGAVFEQRTLVFFAIISLLAVGSFQLVDWLAAH